MPTLITAGSFKAHSGATLPFKIECEALTRQEWREVAGVIATKFWVGPVEGVPRGGLVLAEELAPFVDPAGPLLIVDDVLTTGRSMEEQRRGRDAVGFVLFARCAPAAVPGWVTPMFQLGAEWR